MNILLLNWRDPKNPRSGGAEKLNREILKPLIARGDIVTWYALSVKDLPAEEYIEDIHIIRFGNILTHFLFWPFFLYTGKFGKVDFIIDSIHGIGYLSQFVAPFIKRKILVCEVAKNIWDEMIPFPANIIGKTLEPFLFFIYSRNSFWTISQSTKKDLESMSVPSSHIFVLPMGFDAPRIPSNKAKTKTPTALYVGRLAEMKGIRDAITAIADVNKNGSLKWKLDIIGRGTSEYESILRQLVHTLHCDRYVTFHGYVTQSKKFNSMAKAWVLVVPSSREGWGMIVPEANYVGTQVIAYSSPGLVDSVKQYGKENILVKNTPEALAYALQKITTPKKMKKKIKEGWNALSKTVLSEMPQNSIHS